MITKDINQLRSELTDWESNITASIQAELLRIARPVAFEEFTYNPFIQEVSCYLESVFLDNNHQITLDTSFSDSDEKSLESFMSDSEIDSWGLLGLLDGLKGIN